MPDSVRSRLVNTVETRFRTIRVSGGFNTDLGNNIFVWRPTPFQEQEFPGANIKDVQCDIQPQSAQVWHNTLTMHVDCVAATGNTTDELIRKIAADVWKCIGLDRYWTESGTNQRLAYNTEPIRDEIQHVHEGKVIGGLRLTFAIHFRTKAFDPYTIP